MVSSVHPPTPFTGVEPSPDKVSTISNMVDQPGPCFFDLGRVEDYRCLIPPVRDVLSGRDGV